MKPLPNPYCFAVSLLVMVCQPQAAKAESNAPDSLGRRSANALVAGMAQLIKQYAFFHGGTAVFRYDAWADTTNGLKLYIGEQITVLGVPAEPEWYYIDFEQPVKANELTCNMGRNDNFFIDASKKITKRAERKEPSGRVQPEKPARLFISFLTNKSKRTTDFGQLYKRLAAIVDQLTNATNR